MGSITERSGTIPTESRRPVTAVLELDVVTATGEQFEKLRTSFKEIAEKESAKLKTIKPVFSACESKATARSEHTPGRQDSVFLVFSGKCLPDLDTIAGLCRSAYQEQTGRSDLSAFSFDVSNPPEWLPEEKHSNPVAVAQAIEWGPPGRMSCRRITKIQLGF